MLTMGRRAAVGVLGVAALVAVFVSGAAVAVDVPPGCHLEDVAQGGGKTTFRVVCPGNPGGSSGGSSGPAGPSCELNGLAEYCIGASACWSNVPSAIPVESWPVDSRPSVDAISRISRVTRIRRGR